MPRYRKTQNKDIVAYDGATNYSNVLRDDGKSYCILDPDLPRGAFVLLNPGDLIEVLQQQGRDRVLRVVSHETLTAEGFEVVPE